jgi:hypothetical protein
LNALATTNGKPLRAFSLDEARGPLLVLFSAYPEPWSDKTAEHAGDLAKARVSAYMLGLEGLPAWAIEQTVKDFIQGRIDRPARRKGALPTVEEISAEARVYVDREASKQRVETARLEQIAERHTEFTPEHRLRMKFNFAVLLAGMERHNSDAVACAWKQGQAAMIELGRAWGLPIPEGLINVA